VASWYTIDEARDDWPGAPLDDVQLQLVLDVSRAECEAYAPLATAAAPPADTPIVTYPGWLGPEAAAVVPDTEIPDGHRWAHLAHARNIWNAQKVNPSGGLGDDTQGFALTPWPLEWSIKQRLRPRVIFGGSVG
jgi:hypothetical protein